MSFNKSKIFRSENATLPYQKQVLEIIFMIVWKLRAQSLSYSTENLHCRVEKTK